MSQSDDAFDTFAAVARSPWLWPAVPFVLVIYGVTEGAELVGRVARAVLR